MQRATVSAVLGEWAAALAPGGGPLLLLGGEKPDFLPFCRKGSMRERRLRRRLTHPAASCWRNFTGLKTGSEGVKLAGEGLRRQVTSIHERLVRKRAVRLQELEKSAGRISCGSTATC